MELKQERIARLMDIKRGFNRTFMELKLDLVEKAKQHRVGFNRTFMELKPPNVEGIVVSDSGLIVPLWN